VPRLFRPCPASIAKAYEGVLRGSNSVAALSEGPANSAAGAPPAVALAAGPAESKKRRLPATPDGRTRRGVESKRRAVALPPHNPLASVLRSQSQVVQPVLRLPEAAAAKPRFNDDNGMDHNARNSTHKLPDNVLMLRRYPRSAGDSCHGTASEVQWRPSTAIGLVISTLPANCFKLRSHDFKNVQTRTCMSKHSTAGFQRSYIFFN
jgi:hypothetical protein